MKINTNYGRRLLALLLVFSLAFGLCANGLTVFATEYEEVAAQNDDVLKDFFGEDVTPEEAYQMLIAESSKMNEYENTTFQYVPNKNSFYVALGDETAAITKKQTSSYVNLLASALGVSYENLAQPQMPIQDVYDTITANSSSIAKADLITIGFSNYGATYFMCQYMAGQVSKVTDQDWIELVGEENLPNVKEILNHIFQGISDQNISADQFGGYDLEGGLECYIYTYMSNAIHQSKVIEAIRVFNSKAAIVLVGTYNDLEGVALSVNGSTMDLGALMSDLVNSSNYLSLKNANSYDRVAYVDAPDVDTALDANASKYTTPKQYVFAIVGRQGLPNTDGHKYVKDQILSCISSTCVHTWDEGTVVKEPTCNAGGTKKFTCTWCGESMQESIPASGEHTYATREDNRVEPTCGKEGSYDLVTYCTGCGEVTKTEKKTIAATGKHSYGNWVQTKAPTCTTDGEERQECKGCGHAQTRTVPATGHKYTSKVTAPTCTEAGYTTYTCSCGHSYVADEVAALGHNFGPWMVVKEPSCTEGGQERRVCSRCALVENRDTDKTEHQYTAKVTAPTCTEAGYTTYTCSCGDSYVADEVAALGHDFGDWIVTKEPSCAEGGQERRVCARCGHVETRNIEQIAHQYTTKVTAPTCTEAGFTTYTCATCGDSYVGDEVPALGHSWQTTSKEATCCEDGLTTHTCSVCGAVETEVIAANGNHALAYADNKNGVSHTVFCSNSGKTINDNEVHNYVDGVCDKCGAKENCAHKWNEGEILKAPTCCATGEKRYTCTACGETYTELLEKDPNAHTGVTHLENVKEATCVSTGYSGDTVCECGVTLSKGEVTPTQDHTYGDWIQQVAPTCAKKGLEYHICSVCNYREYREMDMLEHTYQAIVIEPTCTENGYTTYSCVCGHSYVGDEVDALGHAFGKWTVSVAPTCTENGEEERSCTRCGFAEVREMLDSALGHNWKTTTQQETCCEDGLITHVCTVCAESSEEVIPANEEHDLVYSDNENGVGHSVSCRNSGKTLKANELHNYVGGVCDKCGAEENCQHQWDDGEVVKAPTCCATGEKRFVCAECGETYTEILPKDPTAHTGVTTVKNAKEPTCTATGYTGDTVCECGQILEKGQEIPKAEHAFGDWTQTKAPTCTAKGQEKRACGNCGRTETREVEMIGHQYNAVVTAPTCTAGGYTTYTCAACGHSYVADEVSALGHQYKAVVTAPTCNDGGYTTYSCSACGHSYIADEVSALGHEFGDWTVVKAPSCTAKGKEQRSCVRCGETESRELDMIAHQYKATVTAPTCTDGGYTTYTCATCGHSYVADEVSALGHNWQTTTKEATCCQDGLITNTCATCQAVKTQKIAATGEHNLVYTDNANGATHSVTCGNSGKVLNPSEQHTMENRVCTKCGAEENCKHQWNAGEVTKAPTCCATGEKRYTCSDCGETYTEIMAVDPTAHTGVTRVEDEKAPTCTAPGYTGDTVCECGATLENGKEIPKLEHTYQASVTAPTCVAGGYTTYTCTGCGAAYVSDHTEPVGHTWDQGVVTKEPTATENGVKTFTCAVCGATKTEVIEKLGEIQDDVDYELPEDGTVEIPENDCFENGTTVKVEQLEEGDIFQQVQNVMDGREEAYVVFEFTATMNGVAVQPNGKLTVTFAIPAGYSTNVVVYYMSETGKLEQLQATVDTDANTVTVELSHFSTYILADRDTAPSVLVGDVNGDGRINARDARTLLRIIAGLEDGSEVDDAVCDVNGDGRVNARDARALLRKIAGLE